MATPIFKIFAFISAISYFQTAGQAMDSLIVAEGNIINSETKEPVTAHITYHSLPFGNIVGTFNNAFYSFPMFENARYSISVEADGFLPVKYMLDPAEANEFKRLIKNIALTSGTRPDIHVPGHVMRLNNLIFEVSRARIVPESYGELELVEKMMKENPKMIIQLEGHTDYQGSEKQNFNLSKERVESVRKYLKDKGINQNRIKTIAYGGSMPLSKDNTPEAHRLNRRVELRILEN